MKAINQFVKVVFDVYLYGIWSNLIEWRTTSNLEPLVFMLTNHGIDDSNNKWFQR